MRSFRAFFGFSSITAIAYLVTACHGAWTAEEYCEKRQAAWEAANTDIHETAAERQRDIAGCTRGTKREPPSDFEMRVRCYKENIGATGNAATDYGALIHCEQRGLFHGGH